MLLASESNIPESGHGSARSVASAVVDVPVVAGERLGLLVGHSLADGALEAGGELVTIDTPYGAVEAIDTADAVVVPRHGISTFTPAHLIDARRTIAGLCAAGCDRVLAFASSGTLRPAIPVGSVVCPDDVLALFAPAGYASYFTDRRGHRVPGFDVAWRSGVLDAWRSATATPVLDGGVYAQTTGPRFETLAEVRLLAHHADLVGMTLAAEMVLAGEVGLSYAALCTVDNLANGVDGVGLELDDYHAAVAAQQERLLADLDAVLPVLAATPRPRSGGGR